MNSVATNIGSTWKHDQSIALSHNSAPVITNNRERFLRACKCQPVDRPPIWMMRQAGRALPEYRALKEKYTFLQLVQTPELATEVTLQPIRRFGFDAAIFFSDILIAAEAMGQGYHFREKGGIEMDFPINSATDIERLETNTVRERLEYVSQALPIIKRVLEGKTSLLGFAGSPWTLANFMMEGGSAKEYTRAKALFYSDPEVFFCLMEKLTLAVTELLQMQIDAGVDAVQIFDSLGGLLGEGAFEQASARWMRDIISALRGQVPVIVFAKGAHGSWHSLVRTGAQVLGADWTVSLSEMKRATSELAVNNIAVQGNLDPSILTTSPAVARKETLRLLNEMRGEEGFIFNLGHGVPPHAKLDCIETVVTTVRNAQ